MNQNLAWLIIVAAVAAFGWGAFAYGFLPPPNAKMLLCFRGGVIKVKRGSIQSLAKQHVADVIVEAGVVKGFIAVRSTNRIVFS